jgi:hypothetical protein
MKEVTQVMHDASQDMDEVTKPVKWIGPAADAGPTPDDAAEDLAEIERTGRAVTDEPTTSPDDLGRRRARPAPADPPAPRGVAVAHRAARPGSSSGRSSPLLQRLDQGPHRNARSWRRATDCQLQVLGATEQFSVLMRIGLFGGVILGSPVILWQIWGFISPALTTRERRGRFRSSPRVWRSSASGCVRLLGAARGLDFLLNIFDDVRSDLRMLEYFSFAMRFMLAFGVSFLYPVFLFAAAAAGLVTSAATRPRASLGGADHRDRGGDDHTDR